MRFLLAAVLLVGLMGCNSQGSKAEIYQAASMEFDECFKRSEECKKLLKQYEFDKQLDNREANMKELREFITDYEARMERLRPIIRANRLSGP